MKNEYKKIFDEIEPDNALENKIYMEYGKKHINFRPQKALAVAAAFALIVSCSYAGGTHLFKNDNNIVTNNTSNTSVINSAVKDFTIIAYAGEDKSSFKELKDDEINLIDLKIEVKKESDGYAVNTSSSTYFSIPADDDIESVDFKSEYGEFNYFDYNKVKELDRKGEYYEIVFMLTEEEAQEYISHTEINGEHMAYNRSFIADIMSKRDCSEYFNGKSTDLEKYSINFSDEIDIYGGYCFLFRNIEKTRSLMTRGSEINVKTYQKGDIIDHINYFPDEITTYLSENPHTKFNDLPTDNITITVHYKSGQSITKNIEAKINDDGIMTMMYK